MKCPECSFNQRVKLGMACTKCDYRFTFNPKEPPSTGMTDGKFLAAIRRAGQNETAVFTPNQLYAGYISLAKSPRVPALIFAAIITAIITYITYIIVFDAVRDLWPMVLVLSLFLAVAVFGAIWGKPVVLHLTEFKKCISLWKTERKKIPGLIEHPSLHEPPPEWNEDDIYDYGVERVLMVQHDLLVDLFVLNNQHAEQRMLVISKSGYPNYLQPQLNRMLLDRSDLPIFLLHDADPAGTAMTRDVQKLAWVNLQDHHVIDLGFFPKDFKKLKRTAWFRSRNRRHALPADALKLGSLTTGLAACFASQTTFAEELIREKQNQMNDSTSFG